MIMRTTFLSILVLSASVFPAFGQSTAFVDPFTFPSSAGTLPTDYNLDVPARQAGGTLTSTYTMTDNVGHANNEVFLQDDHFRFGPSDVMLIRTQAIDSASQTAIDLDTDFGNIVAGRTWEIEFDAYAVRNSTAVSDQWWAISIGDVAPGGDEAGIRGPNHPSADFAILLRADGRFTPWVDGNSLGSGKTSRTPLWGVVYHFKLIIDDLKPVPEVTAIHTVDGVETNLGTWPVTWDNTTSRFIELRAHQGGQASGAPLMDVRMDNLTINITQDVDGPPIVLRPVVEQDVWTGDPLSLSVRAGGTTPISYQWRLNGVDIPGATDSTYLVDGAGFADAGLYEVTITNAEGTITSQAAIGVIFPTPEQRSYEPPNPSSRRAGIVVSEILYHPAASTAPAELEFIELYNSEPWPTDLSGWRLAGDADFVFPNGTTIPALGYLVVARMPTDVEDAYGISGVLGPWSGNLPNAGGTVRLRKPSDAIVWQADYNDRHPWPVAADGTGHSLVLARPSYGAADPQAWAASHRIGGSPGAADPVPSADLDHLVINEVLANSDPPLTNFIEIHNLSPLAVDVSNCYLSDQRNALTKYQFPPATSIGPQGFLAVEEAALGFALNADGESVFLTSPDGFRVLDTVSYPASGADRSLGRCPDGFGNPHLLPLATLTPGGANAALLAPGIVINEIFFNAPLTQSGTGDWVEIYNRSGNLVDLGGWRFTSGIDFTFPAGTSIPDGGYLVIAEDSAQLLGNHSGLAAASVLGDFGGSLSDSGERVTLSRPDPDGGGFFIDVDTLDYADGSRFSKLADGRGSSLERRDPDSPSRHVSNWADSDESAKSSWTTVEVTGTLAHGNLAAESNPATDVQFLLLGEGEVLVDLVEVIPDGGSDLVNNGGFESGSDGWDFDGNHRDSRVESGDAFAGSNALRLVANRRGDPIANRVRSKLTTAIPAGTTATLRARVRWLKGHPEFDLRLKGGWLEGARALTVPTDLGTPGALNSSATANAAPDISDVIHRPVLPPAGLPFRVFARVEDPDGITSVILNYRVDPATAYASTSMNDDGIDGDQLAGDGIFTARISGQDASTLVGFYVEAEDMGGAVTTFPENASANGAECFARIGEGTQPGPFGTYRFWVSEATLADWIALPFLANNPLPATIVYGDQRVFYNSGSYYGGARDTHNSPLGNPVGYDLILPRGSSVLGADKLTIDPPIRDTTNQREQLMYHFLDLLELPSLHRRDIQLYINGQRRGTIYHDAEQPDGVVVGSHFPGDDGILYKLNYDREGTDAGIRISPFRKPQLDVFEADGTIQFGRYFWNFGPRARGADTRIDMGPVFDLVTAADSALPTYAEDFAALVDMENWMRTFAMNDIASFWDGFGNPNYKNTYLYQSETARWTLFSWDFDVGLGVFNDPPTASLFPGNVDPNIRRLYTVPAFERAYWRAMDEALDNWFTGDHFTTRLQQRYDAYQAAGLTIISPFVPSGTGLSIPDWIDQRRAFLLGEFAGIDAAFAVTSPGDSTTSAVAEITIAGRAPVAAASIEVNGRALALEFSTLTDWAAPFTLLPGENVLVIRALDLNRNEIATQTITVEFTGTSDWPAIVINEWMADNGSTIADPADNQFDDWIELYNPTGDFVDLAGWTITDDPAVPAKFAFLPGHTIPANGYLIVWADDEISQNIPGAHTNFKLSAGGESIAVYAPDGTEIDRVDFGPQAEDFSSGIPAGSSAVGRGILASNTPGTTNSAAPAPMNPVLSPQGDDFDLQIATSPGFSYSLEASTDLITWAPLETITAVSTSHTFTSSRPPIALRYFLRVRRRPS